MNDLSPSLQYSPYFAGLEGKSPAETDTLQDRIDGLPEASRFLLFDPEIPEKIESLLNQNNIPSQYVLALGKIVFLAVLGDVAIGSIEQLLLKLGLESAQATAVGAGFSTLLAPVIAERGRTSASQHMHELPPLTQRVPPVITGPDSSKTPARNIIDLRKQEPTS